MQMIFVFEARFDNNQKRIISCTAYKWKRSQGSSTRACRKTRGDCAEVGRFKERSKGLQWIQKWAVELERKHAKQSSNVSLEHGGYGVISYCPFFPHDDVYLYAIMNSKNRKNWKILHKWLGMKLKLYKSVTWRT